MTSNDNLNAFITKLDVSSPQALSVFSSLINSSHSYYRTFNLPKRRGGYRKIESPYPTLKYVQNLILNKFMLQLNIHEKCFSFTKDRNAIQHAKYHLNCNELLTLDIESFFPSITRKMVFEALLENNISPIEAKYISEICTVNNALPQGACTSPILSNIIFKNIDIRLSRLANSLSLKYSRYADDLAFSGKHIPRNIFSTIEKILQSKSLKLNKTKTKLKIAGSKKIITGVSISSGETKVPKSFKRSLRAQIYELERNKKNLFQMTNFDPSIYEKTLGKINYLLQVEPENKYALMKKELLLVSYKEFLSGGTSVK
jgi:RNA-directed DNA polymerase